MGSLAVIARHGNLADVVEAIKKGHPERKIHRATGYSSGMRIMLEQNPSAVLISGKINLAEELCRNIKTNRDMAATQVVYFALDQSKLDATKLYYDLGYIIGSYDAEAVAARIKS